MLLLVMLNTSLIHAQFLFPEYPAVARIDWHPNGQMIAISDGAANVRIINAETLETLTVLPDFPPLVSAVRWSDTGDQLAITSEWTIQIWEQAWDAQQAELIMSLEVPQLPGRMIIQSIDWNDENQQLLAVARGKVFIWNVQTGQLIRTIEPYTTPLISGLWSNDSKRLASGDLTGYVLVEELATQELGGEDTLDFDGVLALEWSTNGEELAVGTNSGLIEFFSGSGLMFLSGGPLLEAEARIFSMDWHPTNNWLAVGSMMGKSQSGTQKQENLSPI
jgi:WD40 repeat protein